MNGDCVLADGYFKKSPAITCIFMRPLLIENVANVKNARKKVAQLSAIRKALNLGNDVRIKRRGSMNPVIGPGTRIETLARTARIYLAARNWEASDEVAATRLRV